MVGVPRSRGCALCVKRRVKCDERLPGCAKCETYGRPCPGYGRGFKFVAGKPFRTRRGQLASTSNEAGPKEAESMNPPGSDFGSSRVAFIHRETPASVVSGDMNLCQSLSVLVNDFAYSGLGNQRHVVAQWFGLLPSIYGQNTMLDAAIKSFVAHHFGRTTQNEQMVVYARCAYGEALQRLRKSLVKPGECLSSHVFCAVVLLCLYELFMDTENPESWMKHARGLCQLVRMRGPARHTNELDIALLKASRGLIVMHSMFSGEECFLASEEWHYMMRHQYTSDMSPEFHNSIEQFFAYFTLAPSLVHKMYRLREIDVSTPQASQIISHALEQALDMQGKLDLWYQGWLQLAPPPIEAVSTENDHLFPIILTYRDMIDATIYCGYYSYMVIIHETLKTFGYPGSHEALVVYFLDQICQSIEFASTGLLGPYRMGFPLRVAIEVADPATKSWIIERLQEFSNVYAAARPETYQETSK
ncbi:hypothetical protein N7492_004556 [Penicillium capsulatum]|uniref:Zn(2)-C6 fungal-type domain-containing protein n=1 Tax=Penicillium capsulatum TaxID=69766 RepID=A0A9W9IA80_9EURO|nr:hypothetical protein N7492_004556 [Penicillium capsulatum]KAJ6136326.1 hypothetical protein N7512_001486 [Penicillium capsulatum]